MTKHALALLLAVPFALGSMTLSRAAFAESATPPKDCPAGSDGMAEGNFSWCQPSVCADDTGCGEGKVCRMIGLCVEVGTIDAGTGPSLEKPGGAKNKLVAVGQCAAQKKCPESTVCSEYKRCVDRATADRMGILETAPSASPSASAGATDAGKKSACGCSVPGSRSEGTGAALVSMIALGLVVARRRSRDAS